MPLIVTGSIGIDSIQAPTGSADAVLGGSCVYFAAAARLFGPVRLVGAVGDDLPADHRATLESLEGVDLAGLETRSGSKTFRWQGKYHRNMNDRDTLGVELNVLQEALPPVPEAYRDSQYVFLANTHPRGQLALLDAFAQAKLVVADTMDLWIANERDALMELLGRIDGLVLNDPEAFQLTGKTNLVRAAEAILEMGPRFVIIKKGEHGSFVMLRDHAGAGELHESVAMLPAFAARDVVDPTGAGDSFAGGMMGHLAATDAAGDGRLDLDELRVAMAYGTVVASFTIESFSLDRLRSLTRAEVDERLTTFRRMLHLGENGA